MLDTKYVEVQIRNELFNRWEDDFLNRTMNQQLMSDMLCMATRHVCEEFNRKFEQVLDRADTQLLERAAVLLAERVAARGDK